MALTKMVVSIELGWVYNGRQGTAMTYEVPRTGERDARRPSCRST